MNIFIFCVVAMAVTLEYQRRLEHIMSSSRFAFTAYIDCQNWAKLAGESYHLTFLVSFPDQNFDGFASLTHKKFGLGMGL